MEVIAPGQTYSLNVGFHSSLTAGEAGWSVRHGINKWIKCVVSWSTQLKVWLPVPSITSPTSNNSALSSSNMTLNGNISTTWRREVRDSHLVHNGLCVIMKTKQIFSFLFFFFFFTCAWYPCIYACLHV